jgi:hypothetical protein
MQQKKQFNVRLNPATCDLISELADGKYINIFIEELIHQEIARRKGEFVENSVLPLLREAIQQEFLRAISQLQTNIREQMHRENQESKADIVAEMKARERRSDDRLAGLIIRAIREGGISRRMLFTYLAKEDATFAMEVYEDARSKVGKDIATRFNEAEA